VRLISNSNIVACFDQHYGIFSQLLRSNTKDYKQWISEVTGFSSQNSQNNATNVVGFPRWFPGYYFMEQGTVWQPSQQNGVDYLEVTHKYNILVTRSYE
jgi:hypothetical protein